MSCRHSQAIGKCLFGVLLEGSLCNEFECALDGGLLPNPGGGPGSCLGTAAQARSIPGDLRCLGCLEEFDVLALGSSGADRTAVHTRRFYGNEEPAIKAGISCQQGLITRLVTGHRVLITVPSTIKDAMAEHSTDTDLTSCDRKSIRRTTDQIEMPETGKRPPRRMTLPAF